jgi:hypothetical protein
MCTSLIGRSYHHESLQAVDNIPSSKLTMKSIRAVRPARGSVIAIVGVEGAPNPEVNVELDQCS